MWALLCKVMLTAFYVLESCYEVHAKYESPVTLNAQILLAIVNPDSLKVLLQFTRVKKGCEATAMTWAIPNLNYTTHSKHGHMVTGAAQTGWVAVAEVSRILFVRAAVMSCHYNMLLSSCRLLFGFASFSIPSLIRLVAQQSKPVLHTDRSP